MRIQNKKCLFLTIMVIPIVRAIFEILELSLGNLKLKLSAMNENHLNQSFVEPIQKVTTTSIPMEIIEREQSRRIDHIRL